jgi:hypothetical protein
MLILVMKKSRTSKESFAGLHCRRYFIGVIPLDNKGKEIPGSKGAERLF